MTARLPEARLARLSVVAMAAVIPACGAEGHRDIPCMPSLTGNGTFDPTHPNCRVTETPPPTCGEVKVHPWPLEGPAAIPLGESRLFSLARIDRGADPLSACAAEITSVAWSSDRTSVAVEADPRSRSRAWVTGLGRGEASVTVQVGFVDGSSRTTVPAAVTIDAASGPAGMRLVASGRVDGLTAGVSACRPITSCAHLPFDLPAGGRVDVVVDWLSPLDRVGFDVYAGRCVHPSCSPTLLPSGPHTAKPVRRADRLAAGPYTLVPRNEGPGVEDVTYEIWLSP